MVAKSDILSDKDINRLFREFLAQIAPLPVERGKAARNLAGITGYELSKVQSMLSALLSAGLVAIDSSRRLVSLIITNAGYEALGKHRPEPASFDMNKLIKAAISSKQAGDARHKPAERRYAAPNLSDYIGDKRLCVLAFLDGLPKQAFWPDGVESYAPILAAANISYDSLKQYLRLLDTRQLIVVRKKHPRRIERITLTKKGHDYLQQHKHRLQL